MEYTLGEESEAPGQRALAFEELRRQLEKLLKEGSNNQRVFDWIEVCFSWKMGSREIDSFKMGWMFWEVTRVGTWSHNF